MRLVAPVAESSQEPEPDPERTRSWAGARCLLVVSCYLLGAVALTSRLWIDPASRVQVDDLRDVDQMTWFIRYSATAISHFRLPALHTAAMNAPHGFDLLWNTSLLLPGILLTPVTLLAGPQVSLNLALTLGFAGSAAAMFFVLRRWEVSITGAALGGALYGFSPAMWGAGIGHYHLVLAILPPLIIDALLRIVTGRGSGVRNGIWLGLLVAAQLFTGEEMLVDTVIAGGLVLLVLAACRPRAVLGQARSSVIGLATGAGVAGVLCARALWVQFGSGAIHSSGATTVIHYRHHLAHLFALPYAFVTPAKSLLLHTASSAAAAQRYPEPHAEYLAYLGYPLIIVLIAAMIYFWRHLNVRVAAVTFLLLELFTLGSQALVFHGLRYPGALLPWYWLEHLPLLNAALPDRLALLADGAAGAALAFSLDLARSVPIRGRNWRHAGKVATAVAVLALLPLIPVPYKVTHVNALPAGWQATFASLHLAPDARVLLAPVPYGQITQPLRWQADTGNPGSMIGGDFISANKKGSDSRAGRAGQTVTTEYIDALWQGTASALQKVAVPTRAQINADLATWQPAAVVAVASEDSQLGQFLIGLFGQPTTRIGDMLGWRLPASSSNPAS